MSTLVFPELGAPPKYRSNLEVDQIGWQAELFLVSYGVRIGIRTNEPEILTQIQAYLPPGWEPGSSSEADELYSVVVSTTDDHALYRGPEQLIQTNQLDDLLETLDSDLRLQVGTRVQNQLFVHAGVVGWHGRAIVIPGRSFSGKTTLVAAFVKAGATYYSDEYAVLDSEGIVHPYPRRLSIRQESGQRGK